MLGNTARTLNVNLVCVFVGVMLIGCTNLINAERIGKHETLQRSTVGVARIQECDGHWEEIINEEVGTIRKTCNGKTVTMESEGFTGWDVIDAALTGFLSWITFGAVSL